MCCLFMVQGSTRFLVHQLEYENVFFTFEIVILQDSLNSMCSFLQNFKAHLTVFVSRWKLPSRHGVVEQTPTANKENNMNFESRLCRILNFQT